MSNEVVSQYYIQTMTGLVGVASLTWDQFIEYNESRYELGGQGRERFLKEHLTPGEKIYTTEEWNRIRAGKMD